MKTHTVKTGLGYYRDQAGHVITYANLDPGEHPLKDGFTYHEVDTAEELAAIEIWKDPAAVEKAENEKKIRDKIRQIAIEQLKGEGQLPGDYT